MSFKVAPCKNLEEFGQAVFAIGQYFGMEPTGERMERFSKNLPIDRMHAARENGANVGGAGAFPFELTVPGAIVPTAGVTVVGTFPTHRRRGVLRAMMRAQLDDVHARGEPLALLWASEDTIYGRFGYGMASQCADLSIPKEHSTFARPLEREGALRIVDAAEALTLFPRVWDRVRRRTPGMLARSRTWWELRILFEPPGGGRGRPQAPRRAREGRSSRGLCGLPTSRSGGRSLERGARGRRGRRARRASDCRALAVPPRHRLGGTDDCEPHARRPPALVAPGAVPRRMRPRIGDGLWLRLVDVGEALSARTYSGEGAVVFDVIDEFCPWNAGRWRVAGGRARRTTASAQLRLDVSELGSAYLGAFTFTELVLGGRVEELRRGAATRADAMFASERAPWCPEIF